jgi:hypothetical protein
MLQMLRRSLLLVTFVGASIAALGPAYVGVFMTHMMAPQWRGAETAQTLSAFCWYILVLGVNGVSEAFMYAVAPSSHFLFINGAMMLSTGTYALCLLYTPLLSALTGYSASAEGGALSGAARIVYANACGMAVRVVCAAGYDWWYLRKFNVAAATAAAGTSTLPAPLPSSPLLQWVLPLAAFLAAEVAAGVTTRQSEQLLQASPADSGVWPLVRHLLVGVLSGLGVMAAALVVIPAEDSAALLRAVRAKLPARLVDEATSTSTSKSKSKRD